MRFVLLLLVATLSTSTVCARELVAHAQVNGKPALIFDDGFWRYDNDVGEVCNPAGRYGVVCALPSVWSPVPDVDELRRNRPKFMQGEYTAEFLVFYPWGDRDVKEIDVLAYIESRTTLDGLKGSLLSLDKGSIGGLEGKSIVFSAGRYGVFAFTYVNQDGRYLLAQTQDQNTTIYFSGHRKAHQSFVDAIRLEPSGQQ
jgi:hypothetical protein